MWTPFNKDHPDFDNLSMWEIFGIAVGILSVGAFAMFGMLTLFWKFA